MPMPQFHSAARLRFVALALAGLVLASGLLAGCAGNDAESTSRFLVAPGKYVLFNCAQIKQTADENSKRQRELEGLMAKAGDGSAGQMVSAVAYKPEYYQLRGEMDDLRQVAADKKCKFVPGLAGKAQPASTGTLH
jgi:hypothetical protein